MLVFRDVEVFKNTVDRLYDHAAHFEYDHGNTAQLLAALATKHSKDRAAGGSHSAADNPATNLYERLKASHPLSEQVLIAILRSDLSVTRKADLLERNIDFSDEVESALQSARLPSSLRQAISQKQFKQAPFQPVLDDFESLFPGFVSLRKTIDAAELRFLRSGGNPAAPDNPANGNSVGRMLSTLLNSRTEVKIGAAIYLYLPHREITIRNGDLSILAYIRAKGNVPRRSAPVSEPENGLLISAAALPVDPNIVVDSTAREVGCGPVTVETGESVSGRLSFHSNAKGKDLLYYWDFGDGYVSYKENPTHLYTDGALHLITLSVFDDIGLRCGSTGTSQAGSGTGSGTGGANCTLPATFVVQGSDLTVGCVVNVSGAFKSPLTINWDFGDGGFSVSNPTGHVYQVAGTYAVAVTVTDGAGCSYTNQTTVTASRPIPPAPKCCTKYDKKKDGALSPDEIHKFKHTVKTNNSWGITPEVYANVTTYTKNLLGFWFWSYNTSGVNVAGSVFDNDPQTNSCGRASTVSAVQGGKHFFNTIRVPISFKPIYTKFESVTSDGSAFGGNSHLAISDCQ
jgi:hypothetical protein